MKFSARNNFPGTVTNVKHGAVSAEVTINIAPGVDIVSLISVASAEQLRLKAGAKAYVLIKASSVMVGTD
jgi:molybdopterin-binding protein